MSARAEVVSPDQLEGFPHPREAIEIIGQTGAEQAFLEAFRHARLHHAWLICGPQGIGKATLAYRIAMFMLGGGSDQLRGSEAGLTTDRSRSDAQLVSAGTHPNLMIVRRTWNEKSKQYSAFITIDGVRELQNFLGTTAGRGRWRVVIIDAADDLNANAANALLKMLEEPPAFCVFLLVSSRPGRLPVTIRSRCRKLRLEPLSPDDLQRALASVARQAGVALKGADDPVLLHELSAGSVRLALELAREGATDVYRDVGRLIDLLPRVDPQTTAGIAEKLAPRSADQDYDVFMHMLMTQMAKRIRLAAAGVGADKHALAQWAGLWETVSNMRHDAERLNLDRGLFVVDLMARIEGVARRAGGLLR